MEIDTPASQILGQKQAKDLHQIGPREMVFQAIEMMAELNVGSLLVFEENRLAGILTERDYTRKIVLQGRASKSTRVDEIMTRPVITIRPETPANHCMALMTEKHIRYLPVVDEDKVLGILSIGDLIKHIISAQSSIISQLQNYVVGEYPG